MEGALASQQIVIVKACAKACTVPNAGPCFLDDLNFLSCYRLIVKSVTTN